MNGTGWFNQPLNGYSVNTPLALPQYDTPGAIETSVMLTVTSVTGSPSAASLAAEFQMLQPTTEGQQMENSNGGIWTPINAGFGGQPANLPDGDWPAVVADQTTVSTALTGVGTTVNTQQITVASGTPFAVGQIVRGSCIAAHASNRVTAIGSAGGAGTPGSSATLLFNAIASDTVGTATVYTNLKQLQRRITGIPTWRLVLIPTFTGGTSPAFTVSVSTVTRYP